MPIKVVRGDITHVKADEIVSLFRLFQPVFMGSLRIKQCRLRGLCSADFYWKMKSILF